MTQYSVSNYREPGGARTVIGGSLDVVSGGELDIEAGASFKLAGTALTVSAAQINAIAAGTGTTNAVWTIDSDSTDAKLALDTNSATGNYTATFKLPGSLGANRTYTLQDASGTIAFTSDTQVDLDLGSDGTAGSLSIFPSSGTNGKLIYTATNMGAARNLSITNKAIAAARAYTYPDAGGDGSFVMTTEDNTCLINVNSGDRTVSLSGNLSIANNVTFSGNFAAEIAVPDASTWTLPVGGGTLAVSTGAETGTSSPVFTVDLDAVATTKLALLVPETGTGGFTCSISPANHGQDTTVSIPDAGAATDTFALLGKNQTLAGDQIITGTVDFRGNITASTSDPDIDWSGSTGTWAGPSGTNTSTGDFVVAGTKTFATGTGTVTLNGEVTIASGRDLTFAGGDSKFDMAGCSGTFKTPTGTATLAGDIDVAAGKDIQLLAGAGYFLINAAVSGGIKILPLATSTAIATISTANQTNGAQTISIPNLTGSDTFATLGLAQSFTGVQTFSVEPVISISDANNTSVTDLLQLIHTHSTSPSTPGAGMGAGISVIIENDTDNTTECASLDFVGSNDGTKTTLDTDLIYTAMLDGTMRQAFMLDASDQSFTVGQGAITDTDNIYRVRIFPKTQAKGSLVLEAANAGGDFTTTVTNAAMGQNTTVTIPDPGDSADSFVLNDTTATLTGKTIDGATNTFSNIARSQLATNALAVYGIPFQDVRSVDGDILTTSSTANDFHYAFGGFGSGTTILEAEVASNNSKVSTLTFEWVLPPEYVSSGAVKLVVTAIETDEANQDTTLIAEVYESDGEGGTGPDLYNTFDNTSITTSYQTCIAVITDAGLEAGDRLIVFIRLTVDDASGGGGGTANLGKIEMQCDIKG